MKWTFNSKPLGKTEKRVVPERVERSQMISQDQLLIESGIAHRLSPEREEEAWVIFTRLTGCSVKDYDNIPQKDPEDPERRKKKRGQRWKLAVEIATVIGAVTAVLTYFGI